MGQLLGPRLAIVVQCTCSRIVLHFMVQMFAHIPMSLLQLCCRLLAQVCSVGTERGQGRDQMLAVI